MIDGLIIDNFAGGGGASTGIEAALGRPVDVAINHDPQAVAMHRVNHPGTHHHCQSVWKADPLEVTRGRPVALAWFSPDCKHFSKAKGGKPVEKNIRDLAWVVVLWAKQVRPAVIMLENVEEFQTWGPLGRDGKPCDRRRGETFRRWTAELERYGYRWEARELRACDYGGDELPAAPTIRKRLFIIARCDGLPIVWPERTHGPADHADVLAGRLKPWRVAADIIDWSLPCPSIFETAEQIWERWGLRAQRPLAEATLRRIARGVVRYVLEAARPFIIRTDMASAANRNGVHGSDEPTRTQTTGGSFAVVQPFIAPNMTNNVPVGLDDPVSTVTCGHRLALVAPHVMMMRNSGKPWTGADEPMHTVTAGGAYPHLVAAFLGQHNTGVVGHEATEPVSTVTTGGNRGISQQSVMAVHMTYAQQGGRNRDAGDPLHTLTASPKDQNSIVAASMVQLGYGERPGQAPRALDIEAPIGTQVAGGGKHGLVAAHLQTLRGSSRRDQDALEPLRTISAGGNHSAVVGAFLAKYYGTGDPSQGADEPLHTATTKPRHGLVTVQIDGETYAITDIGMRMLTPRERFRAQGFPDSYIIDHGLDEQGARVPLTLDAQGRMCGNSVCPPLAEALVLANVVNVAGERAAA